jgi:hypothetical protein
MVRIGRDMALALLFLIAAAGLGIYAFRFIRNPGNSGPLLLVLPILAIVLFGAGIVLLQYGGGPDSGSHAASSKGALITNPAPVQTVQPASKATSTQTASPARTPKANSGGASTDSPHKHAAKKPKAKPKHVVRKHHVRHHQRAQTSHPTRVYVAPTPVPTPFATPRAVVTPRPTPSATPTPVVHAALPPPRVIQVVPRRAAPPPVHRKPFKPRIRRIG